MTGQIRWADRPTDEAAERWFRARVQPGDLGRWATAWEMVAERVRDDLPDEAEIDGEDVAAATAAHFVAQLRTAMRAGVPVGDVVERGDRGPAALAPHEWARSVLLAEVAEGDKRVTAFRAEHCGGSVLADDAAAEVWVEANVPAEPVARRLLRWRGLDGQVRVRSTGGAGPVEQLRRLAATLAERMRWDDGAAVSFLLYGGVPESPMLTTEAASGAAAWDAAVTLTVHPDVPAELVAEAYRRRQRDLIGSRRPRLLTEPVAEAVTASALPGTWPARWRAHCDHFDGYASVVDFRRAVQRARAKLLSEQTSVPGRMARLLGGSVVEVVSGAAQDR